MDHGKIRIYFQGKAESTVTSYKGGEVLQLVCSPQMLFANMSDALEKSLFGQRVWYKLPSENFGELKMMYSGTGDRYNGDAEMLDEDARVEKNLEGFVDEEENYNDEVTPQNSDCEGDERQYQRCKKWNGALKLGQVFVTLSEFKEAVVDYSLKNGFNVKFTRWGSQKSEVRCAIHQSCKFRIYCSFERSVGMFMIKTFEDEHSCIPDGCSRVVKGRMIANLLIWLAHCPTIFGIDGCFLKNNVQGQFLAAVGRYTNNQLFPVAWAVIQHRMCALHIYGNLRRSLIGKELPKYLFWAVAKSFNIGDYDRALTALKAFDAGVYEAVLSKNPSNCRRAFFSSTLVFEDLSNNFYGSYNNTLNTAREMPLVEMLEKTNVLRWQGKYSEKVVETIKEEKKHLFDYRIVPSGNGLYEVGENSHTYTLDPLQYVSHWYLTSTWRQQYSDPIRPVNGINFRRSFGEKTVEPPPRDVPLPTKKKEKKRIKGKNESPQKKKKGKELQEPKKKMIKLSMEGRSSHCGRCEISCYNSRSCPNQGCPVYRPKKQVSGPSQSEGRTQPSQNLDFG
ncbi:hypothetical protein BRARA_F01881 [Brassica rapa]|uniref:Transposase MuDR plant domain-containing protein n=1 Tax=Brassica campestris TaxID=3711 RepID=A0A397YZC1_BRACM|nr:hypothetical protein BRARA_F01881 [Brassica rapa]